MNFVSWYAEGVGLVRQEWTDLFGAGSDCLLYTSRCV